jgi:hypothetical protein
VPATKRPESEPLVPGLDHDFLFVPFSCKKVRRENQVLLRSVTTEGADQQRDSRQIEKLQAAKAKVDQLPAINLLTIL